MIDDQITVVIPTSPIPSHPSTEIIERVIKSIRFHLPYARIWILADGVRQQVSHRTQQYKEYTDRLFALVDAEEGPFYNVYMVGFNEPTQQSGMMSHVLGRIKTPLTMFVEHDTYLVTDSNPRDEENTGRTDHPEDCIINWQDIADIIASGGVNMVRFYLWEKIWHEHKHLMRGQMVQGQSRFIQTVQYSQWPNIASTEFYRKILNEHFKPEDKKMIEIGMYGPVAESPWEKYRVAIYYPGENNRRFYHLNGRADENGVRDPADW